MLTYANDYKEELQRLGPAGFQRVFFQPVLVTLGMAGEINPAASSGGTSVVNLNDGSFACTRLTGRVFPVVKPQNSMRGPISVGRTSENDIAIPEYSVSKRHCIIARVESDDALAAEATAPQGRRNHRARSADVGLLLSRGLCQTFASAVTRTPRSRGVRCGWPGRWRW